MKKSWSFYIRDILLFIVIVPISVGFVMWRLIDEAVSNQSDLFITKFIKSINTHNLVITFYIGILCLLIFGSIIYGLYCGYQRNLFTKDAYNKYNSFVSSIGIATFSILFFTFALTEIQFAVFSSWISFIALLFTFFKRLF